MSYTGIRRSGIAAAAARTAEEIGARAYTSENHVVVGPCGADAFTLAHELAHVTQQGHGAVTGRVTESGLTVSDPGDAFERAADAAAVWATSTQPVSHAREAENSALPSQAGGGAVAVARYAIQRHVDDRVRPTRSPAGMKASKVSAELGFHEADGMIGKGELCAGGRRGDGG